eukprot:scaffold55546_cov69-Phaeocystis_antarctica.AAC.3
MLVVVFFKSSRAQVWRGVWRAACGVRRGAGAVWGSMAVAARQPHLEGYSGDLGGSAIGCTCRGGVGDKHGGPAWERKRV